MDADELNRRRLGETAGEILLTDSDGCRLVSAHMLAQARRDCCLLTRDLDRTLYDQSPFLDALKELALRGRTSQIRILLQDHEPAVQRGHRLLELARRLTSKIEIRRPGVDWLHFPESFLLIDDSGYVHRELSTRYEASADYHAPLTVRHLRKQFDAIWETSEENPEMRRLHV